MSPTDSLDPSLRGSQSSRHAPAEAFDLRRGERTGPLFIANAAGSWAAERPGYLLFAPFQAQNGDQRGAAWDIATPPTAHHS